MFPVGSTEGRSLYGATWALALLNAVVFYFEANHPNASAFLEAWALYPQSFEYGTDPASVLSLLSSAFLHGGILHLAANLLYLWVFGSRVESRLGAPFFLLLYLSGAAVAGLTHVITHPGSSTPVVGASGAVSALLGAYTVYFPTSRVRILAPLLGIFFHFRVWVPAMAFIALWLAGQVSGIMASTSGIQPAAAVAWWAHLGGFAFGCFAALMLRDFRRPLPA